MKTFRKSEKGFTLMELMVILAILGVLSAVLVPNIGRFIGKGSAEASATELQAVQQSMDLYMADNSVATVAATVGAVTNLSTSNPVLYPNYTRQAVVGRSGGYNWDSTGKVTVAGSW